MRLAQECRWWGGARGLGAGKKATCSCQCRGRGLPGSKVASRREGATKVNLCTPKQGGRCDNYAICL